MFVSEMTLHTVYDVPRAKSLHFFTISVFRLIMFSTFFF